MAHDIEPDPTGAETPDEGGTPATDDVDVRLTELGVDSDTIAQIKEDLGVTTVDDLAVLSEGDLTGIGMKVVQARKLVGAFTPATATADTAAFGTAMDEILPVVLNDESWLKALRTGGVLKVDESTVVAAIRAALASKVGLYDIPAKLVEAMEKFADTIDEQVDPAYFSLRKQLTRRSYADVFEAVPGLDGNYVTDTRKRDLFHRIDEHLWPAISEFYFQLKSWQEAWMQGAANPAAFASMLMAASGGGVGMPPGMMQPPDTGVLRDSSSAVADAINRVFAGTGAHIAAALAYEALEIKQSLEDSRLPAMIGVANRDQMLRQLGVSVNATYPRLETNLTRFVLATLQAQDQPAGNEEYQYFGALYMLGSQINLDQLGVHTSGFSGVAGRVDTQL